MNRMEKIKLETRLKEAVKNEYDQIGAWAIETYPKFYVYQHEFNEISRLILSKSFKNVLDNGAGRGRFAELLSHICQSLFCVDFSPTMVQILIERFKERSDILVIGADSERLPFKDKSFDLIISSQLINHLPSPNEGLKEMGRILRIGGQLILSTGNLFSLVELKERYSLIKKELKSGTLTRFYFSNNIFFWLSKRNFCRYSYWAMKKMAKESGFKIIKTSGAGLADIKNNKVTKELEKLSNLFPFKYFSHLLILSLVKIDYRS